MTMDLLCALLLFVGNVGHLVVLSYKVLKFSELEVGSQPIVALASPSSPSLSALRTCAACSASARKSCWVSLGRSSALRLMAIHSSSFLSAMFSVCSILRQTAEFHPTGYPFCFFTESRIDIPRADRRHNGRQCASPLHGRLCRTCHSRCCRAPHDLWCVGVLIPVSNVLRGAGAFLCAVC
jgi:hypothetical protein